MNSKQCYVDHELKLNAVKTEGSFTSYDLKLTEPAFACVGSVPTKIIHTRMSARTSIRVRGGLGSMPMCHSWSISRAVANYRSVPRIYDYSTAPCC